jgi:ER membrane protein complex subunit 6
MAVVNSQVVFLNDKVQQNNEVVYRVRTMTSLLAGVAAGILGITGMYGFLFFLAHAVLTALAMDRFACKGNAAAYFPSGKKQLLSMSELATGVLTYILVWTLVYDSIYIF